MSAMQAITELQDIRVFRLNTKKVTSTLLIVLSNKERNKSK